ncbi:GMC oxidoreductase [Billgrantia gudaonensis]|uniref:GMC oxidoreductase n=1 Tax=Billgrantia gudaonensis TaxID=376427 RepID=A0A1G9DF28_9GAMM|nr:GMC oxidoreductase [Halomonas gudaonensis]SDK62447.1 GMC oxidoreductase [Halomonas gudaonensis]
MPAGNPPARSLHPCRYRCGRPEDGVCNAHGRSLEVPNPFISDGSQFTASAVENPTQTIVTLALRQAERIGRAMQRGEV